MTNILYGRRCRVLVQIDNETVLDVSDLHCTFKVQTVLLFGQTYTVINIYNLNSSTEKTIITEGSRIILEAGYEGNDQYGQIFDGQLLQPIRWKENGTDYVLSLICVDGNNFLNFGIVNSTIQKGQTQRQVIESIVTNSSVAGELGSISQNLPQNQLIRGKVLFGKSKELLREIAESNLATYYHQDGKINIVRLDDYVDSDHNLIPQSTAIELNSSSGMIGMPEQIASQDGCYIKVRSLMNPKLKIGGMVKLNNADIKELALQVGGDMQWLLDVDGLYLIISADYVGDTRGTDWYVEMTCANHTGNLPVMLTNKNQAGF